jgi:hypothetical protein
MAEIRERTTPHFVRAGPRRRCPPAPGRAADQAAFAGHMATTHVRAIVARAEVLLAVPPEIRSFRRIG